MGQPAISVKGFTFTYSGSDRPAISGIDLNVGEGEFVLIAGPSGCGKTTLCKSFVGLIPHFYPGKSTGYVEIFGRSVKTTPIHKLSEIIGYIFQNPDNQLVMTTVERDVAFGPENLELPRSEIRKRVDGALKTLDLSELREEPISKLSGGQKQKLAIAGVLAMGQRIIVLDEPTSYLSPSTSQRFLAQVGELNRVNGLTVVMVEHRLDLAAQYASKLVVMDEGSIVIQGDPREVFKKEEPILSGLNIPSVVRLFHLLRSRGLIINEVPLNPKQASLCLEEVLTI